MCTCMQKSCYTVWMNAYSDMDNVLHERNYSESMLKFQRTQWNNKSNFFTVSRCIQYTDLEDSGWIYNPRLELPALASPLCGPTCANKYHPNAQRMAQWKCVSVCVCTCICLSQASRGAVLFIIWLDYGSQTCAVWPVRQSSAPCICFPSMIIMTHSRFLRIKLCVVQITNTQLHCAWQKRTSNHSPALCMRVCVCLCVRHWKQVMSLHSWGFVVSNTNTHTQTYTKMAHLHMKVVKLSLTHQILNYSQDLVYVPCKYRTLWRHSN